MPRSDEKPRSDPMMVWEGAEFAFNKVLDDYDARVTAILAGFDPLCLAMFKRVLRRARNRGAEQIKNHLWRQSKKRHSGYVSSRNRGHRLTSKQRSYARKKPKKRSEGSQRRFDNRKHGLGCHKRGPRTYYKEGRIVGHHRIVGKGKESGAYVTGRKYLY